MFLLEKIRETGRRGDANYTGQPALPSFSTNSGITQRIFGDAMSDSAYPFSVYYVTVSH